MGTRAETTKKEKAILKFIENQVVENGYPPSVREIGKAIGLSSTATVHAYLSKLEKQGYIKKEDKKGRTLKIIKGSISDFLNQAENISQMSKYDRDMLDTYRETKEAV